MRVERLTEVDFQAIEPQWRDLLARSDADPLFMGWPWLYSWWETWGQELGAELALFAAYEEDGRLVGLAPFYLYNFRSPVGLRVRRLHFMGNAWRMRATVRTEYSSLILEYGSEGTIAQELLKALARLEWGEMVVCDQTVPELLRWQEAQDHVGINAACVPRTIDAGVRVAVSGHFENWLAELGRNTRLKAYNRRGYLQSQGEFACTQVPVSDNEWFFARLNEFHGHRWGKPCFDESAVRFHQRLLERLDPDQPALSALMFKGEVVAVLYDLQAGRTRYNLQAGFLEELDSKVALGTLHLGYAIEAAFNDTGTDYYDLLAGYGKNSFYKSRFQGETVHFVTVQFARHPVLRWIYRLQSWLPGRLRQSINRFVRL